MNSFHTVSSLYLTLIGLLAVGSAQDVTRGDERAVLAAVDEQQVAEKSPGEAIGAGTQRALPAKGATAIKVTPEREAAVLAFVSQHHPELSELLIHLKENQPREYEAAIRELFRTSERLAQIHERDEDRYAAELRAWKLQSRVQLLSARLKMSDSDEVRDELERTLHEQIDTQLEMLRCERQRLATRLEKLDRQIDQMESKRDDSIQRHLTLLREPSGKSTPGKKSGGGKGTSGKSTSGKSAREGNSDR